MSRYIDANKLIETCLRLEKSRAKDADIEELSKYRLIREVVYDTPTADVEKVVRCKNCKYCEKIDDQEWWCHGRGFPAVLTTPEDYCSKGAKMDGGNDERRRDTAEEARSNV